MKKQRGFTAVELAITISVILILMGMLFVGYKALMDSSRITAAANGVKSIRSALTQYASMHGGSYISENETADMEVLVEKKLLPENMKNPWGGDYILNIIDGTTAEVTITGINDENIRENLIDVLKSSYDEVEDTGNGVKVRF